MRFLRMLTNSLIAGALGAAYLTVLVLQLNPHVPLFSETTWRWFATLGLFYGVHLAVVFYVLMVAREFFSMDILSPGWASVRVLAWLAAAAAAVTALLMWLNLQGFVAVLDETASRRMRAGAAATTASAAVLLGLAIAHYSFGRRGSRVGAALFALAALGSLLLPIAARGPSVPDPSPLASRVGSFPDSPRPEGAPRVVMLLLDGASLEYIWPQTAEGRLPNLARILETGASMDLATIRPTAPDPVWATVATGMYPSKHGIDSGASYYARGDTRAITLLPDHCFSHALVHLGLVRHEANTAALWRARPIWSILSDAGVSVGIVRWPVTYPAQAVHGFIVSDRFHELLGSIAELDDRAAYPADALPVARAAFSAAPTPPEPLLASSPPARSGGAESSAAVRDRLYSRAMRDLRAQWTPQFVALRYQGLDTASHYSLSAVGAGRLENGQDQERRRQAQALERYYTYVDGEIGAVVESLRPEDLLLVVSGFGMQRVRPLKQVLSRVLGEPDMSGTHERAPDGFLLAYGAAVRPGRQQRGSIVDVAPTILYYLGLPIGRDMDGYTRADLFTREFTAERPVAFIPTHNR